MESCSSLGRIKRRFPPYLLFFFVFIFSLMQTLCVSRQFSVLLATVSFFFFFPLILSLPICKACFPWRKQLLSFLFARRNHLDTCVIIFVSLISPSCLQLFLSFLSVSSPHLSLKQTSQNTSFSPIFHLPTTSGACQQNPGLERDWLLIGDHRSFCWTSSKMRRLPT